MAVTARRWSLPMLATVLALACAPVAAGSLLDYWLTPDQQGQRLEAAGDHAGAAARYADPLRRGVALYRAGNFEAAAEAFGRLGAPEGAFNRGNALLLLGRYDDAIASYERAIELRPDWAEATGNLALARLRKERREAKSDEDQGTGGQLAADEIVFDEHGSRGSESQQTEQGGASMSAAEVEALWMRRLQTSPAQFLRARFAYQLAAPGAEAGQ